MAERRARASEPCGGEGGGDSGGEAPVAATRDERPAPTQKWKPKKKAWASVEARASEAATPLCPSPLLSQFSPRLGGQGGRRVGEEANEARQERKRFSGRWPATGDVAAAPAVAAPAYRRTGQAVAGGRSG